MESIINSITSDYYFVKKNNMQPELIKWDEFTTSIDRQVSLKDVLDACKSCHELGDYDRYMPWRFIEGMTAEECQTLDELQYDEEDEN